MLWSEGLCGTPHTPEMGLHIATFCYSLLLTLDDSTGQSAGGIAGSFWLILTAVIALLVWAGMVASWAIICCCIDGNY